MRAEMFPAVEFSWRGRRMHERRYRQVHLDFHTSADCENVGADFDLEVFARTVSMGRVNSMTVFAKCHHGFSYYPTEVGTRHPNLAVPDLMGAQIEALHGIGVLAPEQRDGYISRQGAGRSTSKRWTATRG
jgi:hypothetical protein